jgi:hypothetical protein
VDPFYTAWNEAFVAEYFPEGGEGRLTYLPVDDDEITALAENYGLCDPGVAVDEFIALIRRELAARNGSFTRFTSGLNGWRRVRATPPYVAGLAFCVLAGSRMDSEVDQGIASTNYYTQLNRLLGRPDRAGAPPAFDSLDDAWRDLEAWLEQDCAGSRGISTIRTNPAVGKHVGFPLSQCLLRAVDRRRLPDFFRTVGLEPASEISAARLFALLRAWAALPASGLTQRARRAIARAEDIDLSEIAETVLRELRTWDGELRDERGRRRATIHLLVIPRRRGTSIQLIARRPAGFPDGIWRTTGGVEVRLREHSTAEGWFAPVDVAITSRILEQGLQLTHGDVALRYEAAMAVPCRQADPQIGGWLSQPQSSMWEPQIAVLKRAVLTDLKQHLREFTDGPLDVYPDGPSLPSDWAVTHPFRFTRSPDSAPRELGRFSPRLVATTSLSGGLALSTGVYLTGGEPDALIGTEDDGGMTVTLDGDAHQFHAGSLVLELSRMGLRAGEHELDADVVRRFSSVETFGDIRPPGAGRLGHELERHRDYHPRHGSAEPLTDAKPPAGTIRLSGALATGDEADLPLPGRAPLLVRAGGRRYTVIGSSPEEIETIRPTAPSWLRSLGLADRLQFIEVRVSFEPVWLLVENAQGERVVRPLQTDPPSPDFDGAGNQRWAKAVLGWKDAKVLSDALPRWREYVRCAPAVYAGAPS